MIDERAEIYRLGYTPSVKEKLRLDNYLAASCIAFVDLRIEFESATPELIEQYKAVQYN